LAGRGYECVRQINARGEKIFGAQTGLDATKPGERLNQQTGTKQQTSASAISP